MMNLNSDAMGIVFPNMYDKLVPELVRERLMASIPFAGRYRLVDFVLSSMVNSGVDNIAVIVRNNYHSLLDHLGSGREWDLARKNGGLTIFPPYAQKQIGMYGGRVEAIASILGFLREQKEEYVVMSDTNVAYNMDFKALIAEHKASGADVTIAYKKKNLPKSAINADDASKGLYYTFDVEDKEVKKIHINSKEEGIQNLSLNVYCVKREWLIEKIEAASNRGAMYFERDVLMPLMPEIKIGAYEFTGYTAHISSIAAYYDENMALLNDENLDALFAPGQIYTKIRDDNPTRYVGVAKATNVLVADGCTIEGEVENSILFRGVKIGKGAKVKNSILMQGTVIGDGVRLDHVITDKEVTISVAKELKGEESFPVYVAKHTTV